jgi:hypothetical protein
VQRRSEDEVRDSYADLLGEEQDAATIRLIADLDAGLTSSEPPGELWSRIPSRRTPSPGPSPATQWRGSAVDMAGRWMLSSLAARLGRRRPPRLPSSQAPDPFTGRAATWGRPYIMGGDSAGSGTGRAVAGLLHRKPLRLRWVHLPVIAGLLSLLAVGIGFAVSNITNLGKPVDIQSTAAYFPLSGFHRVSTSLPPHGKPELLFIGAQGIRFERINVERWPVVKALQQFGSLTGIKAVDRTCITLRSGNMNGQSCSIPTFDFTHARYRSRYLTFASKDLIRSTGVAPGDYKDRLFQPLTSAENAVFARYARFRGQPYCSKTSASGHITLYQCSKPIDFLLATIFPYSSSLPARTLPLVAIGHYLQTVSQDVSPSDLTDLTPNTPPPGQIVYSGVTAGMPFDTVRQSLAQGKDPAQSSLVENVNAEANIITALICHADGEKPASVCDRSAIKMILKHVR